MLASTEVAKNLRDVQSERDILMEFVQSENQIAAQQKAQLDTLQANLVTAQNENRELNVKLQALISSKDSVADLKEQVLRLENQLGNEIRRSKQKVKLWASVFITLPLKHEGRSCTRKRKTKKWE